MKKKNKTIQRNIILSLLLSMFLIMSSGVQASTIDSVDLPGMTIQLKDQATPADTTGSLQMILIITIIALAPSILIMMTSFLRIIITLHFVRSAIGTQTMPPNQILVGIALFLTFFVMSPIVSQIKTNALEPYEQGVISQEVALERGITPLKEFMLRQTRDEDISLFMEISGTEPIIDESQIEEQMPLYVLVPAFIISELRAGFIIGFLIYIPFIVIDMVVAATLMSMGMMMLPPATISLPFKILLFVLVDGWSLVIGQLLQTFN
ncbi:MAG: flagellar type III secretion system pore protein FliP [Cellulosilyticum sp.]|nr:flagellar type III secretion system pore protein FliP [Cellulosilyticum sp.]